MAPKHQFVPKFGRISFLTAASGVLHLPVIKNERVR